MASIFSAVIVGGVFVLSACPLWSSAFDCCGQVSKMSEQLISLETIVKNLREDNASNVSKRLTSLESIVNELRTKQEYGVEKWKSSQEEITDLRKDFESGQTNFNERRLDSVVENLSTPQNCSRTKWEIQVGEQFSELRKNLKTNLSLLTRGNDELKMAVRKLELNQEDGRKEFRNFVQELKTGLKELGNNVANLSASRDINTDTCGLLAERVSDLQMNTMNLTSEIISIAFQISNATKVDGIRKKTPDTHTSGEPDNEQGRHTSCSEGFFKLATGCYYLTSTAKHDLYNYNSLRTECIKMNASLVAMETVIERDLLVTYARTELSKIRNTGYKKVFVDILTSGSRDSGGWKWFTTDTAHSTISEEVLDPWYPWQPASVRNCLALRIKADSHSWYTYSCTYPYSSPRNYYVCET